MSRYVRKNRPSGYGKTQYVGGSQVAFADARNEEEAAHALRRTNARIRREREANTRQRREDRLSLPRRTCPACWAMSDECPTCGGTGVISVSNGEPSCA